MQKDRAYYRWQRNRAIRRKLGILNRIGGEALAEGWTRGNNGRLAKGKIHCSCWMCRTRSFDRLPHSDLKCKLDAKTAIGRKSGKRGLEMSGIFGNLFDLNRDGKLDPLELTLEYSLLDNMQQEDEADNDWDDQDGQDDFDEEDD